MLEKEVSMKSSKKDKNNLYKLNSLLNGKVLNSSKLLLSAFLLLCVLFSLNLSSATVGKGDPFFNLSQSGFAAGSVLEGFVNFSLTNHLADAIIRATINPGSIVKEMFLVDFLRNASAIFNCSQDCLVNYSTIDTGEPTKSLSLLNNDVKYLGVVANGENIQIQNLSFVISGDPGNSESTCYETPLKMDLLNDGINDFEYRQATDKLCGSPRLSDCFVMAGSQDVFFTRGIPLCQKININKTGKLRVDAYVKYWDEGYRGGGPISENDIKFTVYNKDRVLLGNCSVTPVGYTEYGFDDAYCVIGEEENSKFYISKKDDYYVCVAVVTSAALDFSIKTDFQPEVCGFKGDPVQYPPYTTDFAIRAQEVKFAPFNTEELFDNSTRLGGSLISYLQGYITTRYQGNCSKGCVMPMKFISTATQEIELRDVKLSFSAIGFPIENNKFYNINVISPKINMTKQSLPFRAMNVTAPEQSNVVYHLSLNVSGAFSQIINFKVASVPIVQNVTPLNVAPNVNTVFRVTVQNAGAPIVSYNWGWDGTPSETTIIPEASHYYSEGVHNLVVKVTDSAGLIVTGTFVVNASLSKDTVNQSLMQKKSAYNNIGNQISSLWYKDLIYNASQISTALSYVESQLTNPSANLNALKMQLDGLKIPVAINDTLVFQESTYFPDIDQIDLSHLSDLGAGFYDSSLDDNYKNAIGNWQEDVSYRLGGSNRRVTFEDGSIQEISLMIIRVSPSTSQNIYFVLNLPSGTTMQQIKTQENLQFHEFSNALGLNLTQSQVMNLAILSSQDFSQIVFYASPDFSILNVGGNNSSGGTSEPSIVLPIIVTAIIFIAVIVVLLFIWRKKSSGDTSQGFGLGQNYGSPGGSGGGLFANPDDLIGLVGYIQSSLAEGKNKNLIEQELLESGWTKEQIKEGFKQTRT